MNRPQEAIRYYRDAIHVQPDVSGPRSNLASLLEQMGDREGATKLRLEELDLLRRDTEIAPNLASVHYRYGLSLYLNGKLNEAAIELKQACELDAENFEFRMALTLLYERLRQWDQAMNSLGVLRELQPENPSLNELEMRFRLQARQSNTTP